MYRRASLVLAFAVITVSISGCAHTYEQMRVPLNAPALHLTPTVSIYVAVPEDGRYGNINYPGSGQTTARVIQATFARHVVRVDAASRPQTVDASVADARASGFSHLVYPTILHWEDRATEWSGKPDRIEIRLMVLDLASGQVVDTVVINGKSRWATFGGDHPQDLLPEPIAAYAASLFQDRR